VLPYGLLQFVNGREGSDEPVANRSLRHRSRNAPEQPVRAGGKSLAPTLDAREHFVGLPELG
jgi:hypothetical protein